MQTLKKFAGEFLYMMEIGVLNPQARYDFFKKKKPSQIKKERHVEIRLPKGTPPTDIVKYIDYLDENEYLRIYEDIIPEEWKKRVRGKKTQSEFVNHGPYLLMDFYRGKPTAVIKHYLKKIKKPYAQYAWKGDDGGKRFFRLIDILEGDWIYQSSEMIDEPIKVDGSKREFCFDVPCRDIKRREKMGEGKRHKFVFINIPTDETAYLTWKDLKSSHRCEYKDNNFFVHYRDIAFDPHDMAALWLIKDAEKFGMKFDIFPRLNDNGREFYMKMNDAVINNSKNLTDAQQDVLLQKKL